MNDHAGFATLISILIVIGSTIILHEADRHSSLSVSPSKPASIATPVTPGQSRSLGKIRTSAESVIIPEPTFSRNHTLISPSSTSQLVSMTSTTRESYIREHPVAIESLSPRSSVSLVQPGEQLTDVAVRVYGSPKEAQRIWLANRDRLASVDAPLMAGWLLRTP